MLKGVSALLSPELLKILAEMGHGDDIAIVDANFPAARLARRLVWAQGTGATEMLRAVLTLLPIDRSATDSVRTMQRIDSGETPAIVTEFLSLLREADQSIRCNEIERMRFYDAAAHAFAIVITGERRLYGNILLRKGVIDP